MMRGDLAHFATRSFFRSSKSKQRADVVQREAEFSRPPQKREGANIGYAV